MSALSIQVPFPVFQDRDGQPLDNGYVWLGEANLNPQTNPVVAYFDSALTIIAAQPLRTINGYISNSGTPAQVYVDGVSFSILVQDSKGSMVYNFADGTGIDANLDSCSVTYDPPFTSSVSYPVCEKLAQNVSVMDFGAVGDGVTDDTAAIQAAIDAYGDNQAIYFPAGKYKISSSIDLTGCEGIHLFGAGSRATEIVSTANNPVIKIEGSSSLVTNSTGVSSMTIRGSGQSNTSADGIYFAWTNSCYLQDLVFFSCRNAMRFGHNFQTDVSNIRVYGAGTDQSYIGVYMEETDLSFIDNAIVGYNINVQGVTQAGFRIINGQGSKFTSCEAGGGPMVYGWHIGEPTTGTVKCQWLHFVNCLGDSTVAAAWLFRQGTASELSQMQLSNCWAGNGDDGFYLDGCKFINISNAQSNGHAKSGITLNQCEQVVVNGSSFNGNNEDASATLADVMIQAGQYNTVAGCTMSSNVAGKSLIEKTATNSNNIYGNNLFQGATIIGTATQVFRNRAFKTEVAAQFNVGAAATTVTVSHSLAVTPPIGSINVQPITALGSTSKFWVNNVTATTFDLNVDVAPGGTITFGYNISLSTLQG
jgi:hypothetical protein